MEGLLSKYNLTHTQLDCELESEEILILANYFDDTAAELCVLAIPALFAADQGDARRQPSTALKVHHCLAMWRQREPSEATYKALLTLVLSEKFTQGHGIAENICEHIANKYDTLTASVTSTTVERRTSPPGSFDSTSDALEHRSQGSVAGSSGISDFSHEQKYVQLTCGCGNCSILGYISGKDKCSGAEPPRIAEVEMQLQKTSSSTAILEEHVSKTQISEGIFKRALQRETLKIHNSFCELLDETFEELEKFVFPKVKAYTRSLLSGGNYSPIYTSFDPCTKQSDLYELREYLQNNFCSWFNYGLIAALRKKFLCPPNLDDALNAYENIFKEYVNRRCFLYTRHLGPHPQVYSVNVVCKIDVDYETITYDQIQDIKISFIDCIQHIPKYNLLLEHVRDGCTELEFRLLGVQDYLLALSPQQKEHLRALGFISITVGSQETILGDTVSAIGLDSSVFYDEGNVNENLLEKFQKGDDPINAVVLLDIAAEESIELKSICDEDGMTLLHLACQWDWSKWRIVVERLVEQHNCDLSATNEDGETPLDIAARFNNEGATKWLVSCNHQIQIGTALLIAHEKQHEGVLRVLTQVANAEDLESLFGEGNPLCSPNHEAQIVPDNQGKLRAEMNQIVIAKKLRSSIDEKDKKFKPNDTDKEDFSDNENSPKEHHDPERKPVLTPNSGRSIHILPSTEVLEHSQPQTSPGQDFEDGEISTSHPVKAMSLPTKPSPKVSIQVSYENRPRKLKFSHDEHPWTHTSISLTDSRIVPLDSSGEHKSGQTVGLDLCCRLLTSFRRRPRSPPHDGAKIRARIRRHRSKGWIILKGIAFPLAGDTGSKLWVLLQLLFTLIMFSLSTSTFVMAGRNFEVYHFLHFVLSLLAAVLAIADFIIVSITTVFSKFKHWLYKTQHSLDVARILVSELVLVPIVFCDMFEVATRGNSTEVRHRVGVILLIFDSIGLILFVFLIRLVILGRIIHQECRAHPPEPEDNVTDLQGTGKKSSKFLLVVCLHVSCQIIVQILMLIAVGAKIVFDNRDYATNGNIASATTFLWYMLVGAYILPMLGIGTFFIVNNLWVQQYLIGLYHYAKVLQAKGVLNRQTTSHLKLCRRVQFLNFIRYILALIIYVLMSPLPVLFCVVYFIGQLLFFVCSALAPDMDGVVVAFLNDGPRVFGGWTIYVLVSGTIVVIINIVPFLVAVFWFLIIFVAAVIAPVTATISLFFAMRCAYFYSRYVRRKHRKGK